MSFLIVYDFDDTLFPSESYVMHAFRSNNITIMNEIDNLMSELLNKSLNIGDVMILSDGDSSWLKEILSHLPKSRETIHNRIPIISTIVRYEKWHRKLIEHYKSFFMATTDLKSYTNIVNVGDGQHEKMATNSLRKLYPTKKIKHISFIYKPSYRQWKKQMQYMINKQLLTNDNMNIELKSVF